jgi:hypothetical protein
MPEEIQEGAVPSAPKIEKVSTSASNVGDVQIQTYSITKEQKPIVEKFTISLLDAKINNLAFNIARQQEQMDELIATKNAALALDEK